MDTHGKIKQFVFSLTFIVGMITVTFAAKLAELMVVDQQYLMIHFLDGEVSTRDDGVGQTAFITLGHENDNDTIKTYGEPLDTDKATTAANWLLSSSDDAAYGADGAHPTECFRKSKLNGMAELAWGSGDFNYDYTMEHYIYLALPEPMSQGKTYKLSIGAGTGTDVAEKTFTFDIFNSRTEALHCNLVGYAPDYPVKAVDLYLWMGDGGGRDYSDFEGNKVYIVDAASGEHEEIGEVSFWKQNAKEAQSYNLIQSDVWNADFSSFSREGTFRIAVEGVGCSENFTVSGSIYYKPFEVSTKGFFYMRIGEDTVGGIRPVPRRPLYIPGVDPPECKVFITTMQPYHENWESFSSGDYWDKPNDWKPYVKNGSPTNNRAIGGHSDAADWDRHFGHVSIIWDMLLPFILTKGAIADDNLGIAESGNGIPDIIDEARNEVDFWLSLRDGAGYSHGLTNPNSQDELYQAGTTPIAAWGNAANAAMLADCFRIAGKTELTQEYRDSAIIAFDYADALDNSMLDTAFDMNYGTMRGRDLRMMAAAYLYNVTADTKWEDIVNEESVCTTDDASIDDFNTHNQLWGTAAYLMTPRTVNYKDLQDNMKAVIVSEAKKIEADYREKRPSRRAADNNAGYFQTMQKIERTIVAHAVADESEKEHLLSALILEADWGLGRNPLNMIQMTTASTSLAQKRSVQQCYTSGGDDGSPGMHPGHTPYMNIDDWACGMVMGCPSWLYSKSYPENFKTTWPRAEAYFNTRYVWAHGEFTPQQTMSGKMALYGYLYGLGTPGIAVKPRERNRTNAITRKSSVIIKGTKIYLPTGSYALTLFDLSGKVRWQRTKKVTNSQTISLPPDLARRIYVLRVTDAHGVSVQQHLLRIR